ncbi:LOW QUALITY PROTEIN: hypothetical protein QTO34_005421 [Cnephaeus nilssonii]|uniref:Uncharacterized protein n=1 Tax=Cnephaeus nilssonii TaxID=3371016 RepID=A0AA40HPF3_CNENI|nr:LOW QUALITY PROTEIN: hypothetical protein QTO34_005421 [Eptesicus nilssonii]
MQTARKLQEKGSPISSTQSRGPVKSRADTGNFLEKLGHQHISPALKMPQSSAVAPRPFNSRALSCKVTNTKSCGQEAVCRESSGIKGPAIMGHPSPTCKPPAAQGSPAALTTAEGTVFRDPSLICRQKTILQNFHGKKFPTTK